MKELILGHFKTKKEATEFVRKIVNSLAFGPVDDPEIENVFRIVLNNHERALEKIGPGIKKFHCTPNDFGQRTMMVERVDGSMIDFSWVRCVNKTKKSSHYENLNSALREAVFGQIVDAKAKCYKNPDLKCELCAVKLTRENFHMDHEVPFRVLAEEFQSAYGFTPKDFDSCPVTHRAKFKKDDAQYRYAWQKFHMERAKLRPLCAPCNLGSR